MTALKISGETLVDYRKTVQVWEDVALQDIGRFGVRKYVETGSLHLKYDAWQIQRDPQTKALFDWAKETADGGWGADTKRYKALIAKDWEYSDPWVEAMNFNASDMSGDIWLRYTEAKHVKAALRDRLKNNLLIKVRTRHDPIRQDCSPQELQARLLLRDMLSEKEWRRYVTNGFIMVCGGSGNWYQIFPDQRWVVVFKNNVRTHKLCVHTAKDCPPTDHLINLKTLIEIDEAMVWKLANAHQLHLQGA